MAVDGDKLPRATKNEWLRRTRGETSQKRLARESGVLRNTVNEVEAGTRGYSLKCAEAIADVLDEDALEIYIESQITAIKNKKTPEKSIEALARLRGKLKELEANDEDYDEEALEDAISRLSDEISDVLEDAGVGTDDGNSEDDKDDEEDDPPRRRKKPKKSRKSRARDGWHPDDKDPRNPHYLPDNRDPMGSKLDSEDEDESGHDDDDEDDDLGRDAMGVRRNKDL